MTQELINEIIDLVNEQRDSQGMITKVDLTLKIKTLLETSFKNNSVLDDVINCLKVGQKVDWQGKMFYVQEDDGGDRILISNHLDDIVPFYNDWWVDRNEVNCL